MRRNRDGDEGDFGKRRRRGSSSRAAAAASAAQQQREPHLALSNPELLSRVFKFAVRPTDKDVWLVHVSRAWETTAIDGCPWMWQRLLRERAVKMRSRLDRLEDIAEEAPPPDGAPPAAHSHHHFNRYVCTVWARMRRASDATLSRLVDPVAVNLGGTTDGSKRLSEAALTHLGRFPTLRKLDVYGCRGITTGTRLIGRLRSLTELDLSETKLSDDGMSDIALGCTLLRKLLLVYCYRITDRAAAYIGLLEHLEVLDLAMCDNITDVGVSDLSDLTELRALDLSGLVAGDSRTGARFLCASSPS